MTRAGRRTGVIRIRPAEPEDAATLSRFGRALSRLEGDPTSHFTEAAVLRDGFGRKREYRALVAELDGRPVGYTLDHDAYDSAWAEKGVYLIDVYVLPRARRKGVARALLAAVARAAQRRRRSFVWWASKETNAEAHAFYASLGASSQRIRAHSLTSAAFENLAEEGKAAHDQGRLGR